MLAGLGKSSCEDIVVETLIKIELVWKAIQFFFLTVIFEMTSVGEGMVHFFFGFSWGLSPVMVL